MFLLLGFLIPFLGLQATILLGLFLGVSSLLFYYIKQKQKYWERKGIKYVKPKFFVGNLEIIRSKSFVEAVQEIYKNFPEERYHGAYQFTQPTLVIKDPDLIKQITVKDFDHFLNHRQFVDADNDRLWSKNLFASRDERWRDLRSTLSPSFTSSKMKIMYTLIDESAREFVAYFKKTNSEVIELEMKDTLRRYTNDVIATTAFGLKCNSLQDRNNDFYVMGTEASNFGGIKGFTFFLYGISPMISKLLKIKVISSKIANYFTNIIEDTVKTREEKKIVRPDMIHLLMEAQKGRQHHEEDVKISEGFSSVAESDLTKNKGKQEITLEDISSQAFIFFLAGFETVSTFLTFAFYELALNPDLQQRVREELESASGEITYEALLGMKYLDMFVSEVLRKWPPAVITDRQVSKEYTIEPKNPNEKPLLLEKGLICWLPIFAIHNDERFYPNPSKFDPERFNDDNKHKINPSVYMPFGAGPRNCIGSRFALLESKLIIFHILRNFEVVTTEKTQNPLILDKYQLNIAVQGGMWLGLKKLDA